MTKIKNGDFASPMKWLAYIGISAITTSLIERLVTLVKEWNPIDCSIEFERWALDYALICKKKELEKENNRIVSDINSVQIEILQKAL